MSRRLKNHVDGLLFEDTNILLCADIRERFRVAEEGLLGIGTLRHEPAMK